MAKADIIPPNTPQVNNKGPLSTEGGNAAFFLPPNRPPLYSNSTGSTLRSGKQGRQAISELACFLPLVSPYVRLLQSR